MKKLALLLLVSISTQLVAFAQGYRIEAKIDGIKDTEILLGYHFGERKFVSDTAAVDSKGVAVFKGDSLLPGGMYIVILPEKTYFDILLSDNQKFSFSTNVDNPIENLTFRNSPENTAFVNYQRFMNERQSKMGELREKMQNVEKDTPAEKEILSEIEALDKEVKAYWDKVIDENKGTLFANIIKSLKPIEFPEFVIPDDAPNPDSLRWVKSYRFNQQNYFANIDLTDDRLTRTPFFQSRVDSYFDRVLLPVPDTISKYAIELIEKTRPNPKMFQFMVTHLFSKYQNSPVMGMDAVFVRLADNYYLSGDAFWISDDLRGRIEKRVNDLRPNLIGEIAPNLAMMDPFNNRHELHAIDAKAIVIYFWEPNCSHCKRVTPVLKEIHKKYNDKGVEVFAIYTQAERTDWIDYIEKNDLNWINVWDPVRSTQYHKLYDIYSTPVLYVLDKDKKIIAKRIGVENLERFIEQELGL